MTIKCSSNLVCIVGALILASCNSNHQSALQKENDSLRSELGSAHAVMSTLAEVRTLIDSIDVSRNVLHVNMIEGITYNDYVGRLQNINDYVKRSEMKISALEETLRAEDKTEGYFKIIDALKDELDARIQIINKLESRVAQVQKRNKELVDVLKVQSNDIAEIELQLDIKQNEISFLEARIDELVYQLKITEADAFYAKAMAVEEAANRTRLAPSKKRALLTEAFELYQKASALGKPEAQSKVSELTKRI